MNNPFNQSGKKVGRGRTLNLNLYIFQSPPSLLVSEDAPLIAVGYKEKMAYSSSLTFPEHQFRGVFLVRLRGIRVGRHFFLLESKGQSTEFITCGTDIILCNAYKLLRWLGANGFSLFLRPCQENLMVEQLNTAR